MEARQGARHRHRGGSTRSATARPRAAGDVLTDRALAATAPLHPPPQPAAPAAPGTPTRQAADPFAESNLGYDTPRTKSTFTTPPVINRAKAPSTTSCVATVLRERPQRPLQRRRPGRLPVAQFPQAGINLPVAVAESGTRTAGLAAIPCATAGDTVNVAPRLAGKPWLQPAHPSR